MEMCGGGKCSDTSYTLAPCLHRPTYGLLDARTPHLHDPGWNVGRAAAAAAV